MSVPVARRCAAKAAARCAYEVPARALRVCPKGGVFCSAAPEGEALGAMEI